VGTCTRVGAGGSGLRDGSAPSDFVGLPRLAWPRARNARALPPTVPAARAMSPTAGNPGPDPGRSVECSRCLRATFLDARLRRAYGAQE